MDDALCFEPLRSAHIRELAAVLLDPDVYRHIETTLPSLDEFESALRHAIAGPGASQTDERWLNFLVRNAAGAMIGRLEATIHHGVAEVAFLFAPRYWGRGWASIGLQWLENEVARSTGVRDLWATTTRENIRCQRLLQRCGYVLAQPPDTPLYSHDAGDLVFHRACAAESWRSPTRRTAPDAAFGSAVVDDESAQVFSSAIETPPPPAA